MGITSNMARDRWNDHKSASKKHFQKHCAVLFRAIRKQPDLIYEVVVVANTRSYCERIEGLLRPENHIGWNIARGGLPVEPMMGGLAYQRKWIQHWIDHPVEAANRWWKAELAVIKQQHLAAKRKLRDAFVPHTKSRAVSVRNKQGLTGVSWYKPHNKWRAQIGFDGIVKFLGYFDDPHEAHSVYLNHKQQRVNDLLAQSRANPS